MTTPAVHLSAELEHAKRCQCDLGNGEFDHDWEVVHDWEGDPGVIGGTQDICYLRCRACGEENYDIDPLDYVTYDDESEF